MSDQKPQDTAPAESVAGALQKVAEQIAQVLGVDGVALAVVTHDLRVGVTAVSLTVDVDPLVRDLHAALLVVAKGGTVEPPAPCVACGGVGNLRGLPCLGCGGTGRRDRKEGTTP